MEALVINIGNTRTTAALMRGNKILRLQRILTAKTCRNTVLTLLRHLVPRPDFTLAAICSVVPNCVPIWQTALHRHLSRPALIIRHSLALGIRLDYPQPATLGADRLANAVGAFHQYGAPVIVADIGTATTLDLVDARGCFVGGMILPGPALYLDYLAERTALLPSIAMQHRPLIPIGRNTRAAMRAGAFYGMHGAFRTALEALRRVAPPKTPVCVTGGCAAMFASQMPGKTRIDPNLTLHGVYHILRLNFEKNFCDNAG